MSPNKEEDGSITFGGYDLASFAKEGMTDEDIFWSNTYGGERYWTVPMIGAMYSKEPIVKEKKSKEEVEKETGLKPLEDIDGRYAILDTGVSYSLIPSRDFIKI